MVEVLPTFGLHVKLYDPVPPFAVTDADPLELPQLAGVITPEVNCNADGWVTVNVIVPVQFALSVAVTV